MEGTAEVEATGHYGLAMSVWSLCWEQMLSVRIKYFWSLNLYKFCESYSPITFFFLKKNAFQIF